MTRRDQLPVDAVRDLLGIARAMYGAAKRRSAPEPDLVELTAIGAKLKLALDLARRTGPDTVGHRAAWEHAEDATSRLVSLISVGTPAAPIIEAAALRFRRLHRPPTASDKKRAIARRRG